MLGLSTSPSLEMYDLAVIGGGPAGLAAAVYGASEGLKTVLIESTTTGGQAGRSSRIENYLGFPNGVSGAELTTSARRQAERFGAEVITTREVVKLDVNGLAPHRSSSRTAAPSAPAPSSWPPASTTGSCRSPGAGTTRTNPTAATTSAAASTTAPRCRTPRSARARTSTSSAAPTRRARPRCSCRETAKSVTMLVRGPSLEASMSHYLIEQIEQERQHPRPHLHRGRRHRRRGRPPVRPRVLENKQTGEQETVTGGRMCCFIGATPRTDWLDGVRGPRRPRVHPRRAGPARTSAAGRSDRPPHHLETSVPGVFVAGDVRAESAKRVAAAVGEGSMAVMLVHRYLAEA